MCYNLAHLLASAQFNSAGLGSLLVQEWKSFCVYLIRAGGLNRGIIYDDKQF